MPVTRTLTAEDWERLDAQLARFRTEFECWTDVFPNNWELLDFVRYEGIERPITEEVGPLILGQECVALHGAQWCMVRSGDEERFAIVHDDLKGPVDLSSFKPKYIKRNLSQKWQRILDTRKPAR